MGKLFPPIIEVEELNTITSYVLINAGNKAEQAYLHQHLQGAIYIDLEKDLSIPPINPAVGGRHPLPPIEKFAELLGNLGIQPSSHVVIYDNKQGSNAAARFWWMLKSIGHEKAQVLNGGLQAALAKRFPMKGDNISVMPLKTYPYTNWLLPTVNLTQVKHISDSNCGLIIDVRESNRYDGFYEPLDLIAGHIPNAINIPFNGNLNKDGYFLSAKQLKEKYKHIFCNHKAENIIVHCGSGVTACQTLLALAIAGYDIPNLYVGSWSEWSRNNYAIATL